jgi:hypothetical protein
MASFNERFHLFSMRKRRQQQQQQQQQKKMKEKKFILIQRNRRDIHGCWSYIQCQAQIYVSVVTKIIFSDFGNKKWIFFLAKKTSCFVFFLIKLLFSNCLQIFALKTFTKVAAL